MNILAQPGSRSRAFLLLCCVAAVLLTVACGGADGKLDAARGLAQMASRAEPTLTAIPNDYYASCVREYNWLYAALPDVTKKDANALKELKMTSAGTWCETTHAPEATQQWQKTIAVLLAYLRSLGDLAGGQANDYGIPGFVDQIVTLNKTTKWFPTLDSDTTATVKTFGAWIAQTYFAAKRKAAIADVVPTADPYVQNLTGSLSDIAKEHYRNTALQSERTSLDKFYLTTWYTGQPAPSLADRTQWMRDQQALANREAAVDAYLDALDKIGKAHVALVKMFKEEQAVDPADRDRLLTQFNHDIAVLAHVYATQGVAK